MLWSTKELRDLHLAARDGDVGSVREIYFDDERWTVRYLVVRTGSWLAGRDVLVSPHAVERLDREAGRAQLTLTRAQLEGAPPISADRPVSRQEESSFHDHYGYPYYWVGPGVWGALPYPLPVAATPALDDAAQRAAAARERAERENADPHLRSSAEVIGYTLRATDDTIGGVDDFLFDDRTWTIEHLVVDTTPWWPGGEVLLPRRVLERIHGWKREASVAIDRQTVKDAPGYVRDPVKREETARQVQLHYERMV